MNELKPVGGEDDGALKYVFKMPKAGKVTCEFLDGTKVDIEVETVEESSGKYAFVGKGGNIFQT